MSDQTMQIEIKRGEATDGFAGFLLWTKYRLVDPADTEWHTLRLDFDDPIWPNRLPPINKSAVIEVAKDFVDRNDDYKLGCIKLALKA